MSGIRYGSLFSGVGGLDMAIEQVFPDATPAWMAEFDPAPSKVLARRWPGVPNLGDVTKVDWASLEPVDLICGGSPCQDVSQAGRRAGMVEGTRSNLWVAMREAISIIKPKLVVWENVRGAASANASCDLGWTEGLLDERPETEKPAKEKDHPLRALGRVLGDLSDLGFDAEWRGIRASDLGACHQRFRIFVVAWRRGLADTAGDGRDEGGTESTRLVGRSHAAERGDEDVTLLRTPTAQLAVNGGSQHPDKRKAGGHGPTLADEVEHLLPTPVAQPSGNAPEEHLRKKPGREVVTDLSIIVENDLLSTGGKLLPTPKAGDADRLRPPVVFDTPDTMPDAPNKGSHRKSQPAGLGNQIAELRRAGGHSVALQDVAEHTVDWGLYEPAIRSHELLVGRPAPEPTQLSKTGKPQLSPRFVEWMMGWPEGWVTDPAIGLTRAKQLRACGNGVVPQQAAWAIRDCLNASLEAVA